MSPCDQLSPFIDGELSPSETYSFRIHLAECSACERDLFASIELEMVAKRVFESAPQESKELPPLWSEWGQLGFVAGVVLLLFLLSVFGMLASFSGGGP